MSVPFRVYAITDRTSCDDVVDVCRRISVEGVAIQIREKDLGRDELTTLVERVRNAVTVPVLGNASIELAAHAGVGVHLTSAQLEQIGDARSRLGADALIGASTHSPDDVKRAAAGGSDFVVFGPVYETPSKAPYGPPQGLSGLEAAVRAASDLPVFAIGGINLERTAEVMGAGAYGVAAIRAVMAAADPAAVVRQFLDTIEATI